MRRNETGEVEIFYYLKFYYLCVNNTEWKDPNPFSLTNTMIVTWVVSNPCKHISFFITGVWLVTLPEWIIRFNGELITLDYFSFVGMLVINSNLKLK